MHFKAVGITTLFQAQLAVETQLLESQRLKLLGLILGRAEISLPHSPCESAENAKMPKEGFQEVFSDENSGLLKVPKFVFDSGIYHVGTADSVPSRARPACLGLDEPDYGLNGIDQSGISIVLLKRHSHDVMHAQQKKFSTIWPNKYGAFCMFWRETILWPAGEELYSTNVSILVMVGAKSALDC